MCRSVGHVSWHQELDLRTNNKGPPQSPASENKIPQGPRLAVILLSDLMSRTKTDQSFVGNCCSEPFSSGQAK